MVEVDILLIAIFVALCFIASRLGKTNEILNELLASSRRKTGRIVDTEGPLPPPLTLDEGERDPMRGNAAQIVTDTLPGRLTSIACARKIDRRFGEPPLLR